MKRNVVAWAALVVSTAALISSRGVTRQVPAAPGIPAESQKTAKALSDAFVAVADFVRPSVVQISVERSRTGGGRGGNPFQNPNGGPPGNVNPEDLLREMMKRFRSPDQDFGPEREQFGGRGLGTGSGFVYDDAGHILTNNHVVDQGGKITVTFHDGTEANATVVGRDPKTDVAVIKVESSSFRALPKGQSSKLRVGDLVMAVGSPFGLSQSVTMGIVSATERNNLGINEGNDTYESFIQTDAPINPGNSGGPLVDMEGRVIGINSAIMSGGRMMGAGGGNDGVGFAIPIDLASHVADKLIKDGKINRARMGVQIQQLLPGMAKNLGIDAKTKGALVGMVLPGSPADKAGLKSGDVITEFNGTAVTNVASFRLSVASSDIGKPATVKYYRDGKEHSAEVVLGSSDKVVFDIERDQKEGAKEPEEKPAAEKASLNDFGLEVQALTPELAKGLGFAKETKGLLISSVKEDSPADDAGLKQGMVITQVVQGKPQDVSDLKTFQELSSKSNELMLYVKANDGVGTYINLSKKK
ncbi:trypsin-like peptidase domain-containing protein [Singulisphaera sp. PoT]|uniref:trypsin-like peptidase domain-containing protein n=1 Tax=Singulisphaera sp. PoT TaxID=3411797 RepID=UPI003BF4BB5B